MRAATAIISLVMSVLAFIPTFGEGIWRSRSGFGFIAVILWIVGAALVLAKPKMSTSIYGVAALAFIAAGATGYTDGYVWAVASAVFAAMSWVGIKEKARKQEQGSPRYQADRPGGASRLQEGEAQPPRTLRDLLPGPPRE